MDKEKGNEIKFQKLPRGAIYFENLSIGPLLIGCPPESLKDIMALKGGKVDMDAPRVIVIREQLFDAVNKCICEEIEQFVFYNFFVLNSKTIFVCTESQSERQKKIMSISTFGQPLKKEDIIKYYPDDFDVRKIPDLKKELDIFAGHIKIEDMMEFSIFDPSTGSAVVETKNAVNGKNGKVRITREGAGYFTVEDMVYEQVQRRVHAPISAPRVPFASIPHPKYVQLRNAISFVSTSSGFDPIETRFNPEHLYGSTVSFVIWDDLGTGTVVDPSVGFPNWMRMMGINFYKIQDLILTHTHSDHDVGTIERILVEPVNVHTTETIMKSFLEKSAALTGISEEQISKSINFYPIKLHTPVKIGGFVYYFSHCLHSIETIRFTFKDHEENKYYYSSDILYYRKRIQELVDEGKITPERMQDILTIPDDAKIYIQEQGGPYIHTPPEAIAEMPEHVRKNMWIVHTNRLPTLEDGSAIPGVRLAKPGMILQLETPREPEIEEFASTYQMLSKLDRIPLFHNLPMTSINDLREILRLVTPRHYGPGEQIIKFGSRPDKIFILVEGSVEIKIPMHIVENGVKKVIYHKIHRDDFGFMIGDAIASQKGDRRDADVFAGSNGLTAIEIDEHGIVELERKNSVLGQMIRKNREMRKHGVYLSLEKIPVVKDLPYSQKQEFAILCHEYNIKTEDDRWLVRQGEYNEYVYIVAEGQVEIIVHETDGRVKAQKRVATSESNLFGEISILTGSKTIASVYLTSRLDETKVYRMHKNNFNEFLRNNPNFNLNFRKNMEERIMETSQVRKNLIDALKSISKEYLDKKKQ